MELGKDRDADRLSLHLRKQFARLVHVAQANAGSQANVRLMYLITRMRNKEAREPSTANSDNKTLIKNQLLIRKAKCFHLVGWERENKIAVFVRPNADK